MIIMAYCRSADLCYSTVIGLASAPSRPRSRPSSSVGPSANIQPPSQLPYAGCVRLLLLDTGAHRALRGVPASSAGSALQLSRGCYHSLMYLLRHSCLSLLPYPIMCHLALLPMTQHIYHSITADLDTNPILAPRNRSPGLQYIGTTIIGAINISVSIMAAQSTMTIADW